MMTPSERSGRPQRASESKQRPAYAIRSVDNALRLATILQLEGRLTVTEAAERIGVAPSTAHRLLGMLVYRDFASQEQRTYVPGPVLDTVQHSPTAVSVLREVAMPHLETVARELDETCNLEVRVGTQTRFIASVEGTQSLRVTNREGMSFPLHRTTGGLQILASMANDEIEELYEWERTHGHPDWPRPVDLDPVLAAVRRTGVSLNHELSEAGIAAVGVPVFGVRPAEVVAGIACSLPVTRFSEHAVSRHVAGLRRASDAITADLRGPTEPEAPSAG